MASHLHARKKNHLYDGSDPESAGISHHAYLFPLRQNSVRKRKFQGPSELLVATFSISGFLVMGLMLSYILMHHQHRKVILHVIRDPLGHGRGVMRGRQGFRHHFYSGAPRYVTIVLPSVVNRKGRAQRLSSIQDTWGGSARAIYVVHNVSEFPQASHAVISEFATPEDHYSYPQLLLLPPGIAEDNGVSRLIYTIRSIHNKVDPDFALFVNDHTYVIAAHLCKYLDGRSPDSDVYEGHALRNGEKDVFNSGAAGYLLSRSTMKKLVELFDSKNPKCLGAKTSDWLQQNPGLVTLQCINDLGIHATDTRADGKWHRFHAFPLIRLVQGDVDEWYRKKHVDMDKIAQFDPSYNELLKGEDCCSSDTISFHYVEWRESKALFAIQEQLLQNPRLSDHELKFAMQKEWPSSNSEIGFYSKGLPSDSDKEGWQSLLSTIRKISTRNTQGDC